MNSPKSFSNSKDLKFVFTLASRRDPFVSNGQTFNALTVQGLRASVQIDNAGGAMMGTLRAQIFGLSKSHMASLTSSMWEFFNIRAPNTVQVFAIDGANETLVYNGIYVNGWAVYDQMPDTYMLIEAQVAYDQQVIASGPLSLASDTTVGTIMANLAKQMGFSFENNGVNGSVVNTVVPKGTYMGGSPMEQARNMMRHYRFWMYIDSTNPNTLAITPYGVARDSVAPLISAPTGLINYPVLSSTGIIFETLFNPQILFGGQVEVESQAANASGVWTVVSMSHNLSSQMPGGPWSSTVSAVSSAILEATP